jgi:hypothetical protein
MKKILVLITATGLLAFGNTSYAQTWNAFNDFYLNISTNAYGDGTTLATINTYSGVSIPSSPSSTGSAWGYYYANINGFGGYPNGIPSTDDNGGQASSFGPVFLSAPAANGGLTSLVGGAGQIYGSNSIGYANGYFAGYAGAFAFPEVGEFPVIASYNREWFDGSANSQGGANVGGTNSSLLWLQGATFASTPGDGIASVLTWTAPTTGTYLFSGVYTTGNANFAPVDFAVVNSSGTVKLVEVQYAINQGPKSYSFTDYLTAGQQVQFQVGGGQTIDPNVRFSTALGLSVEVTVVPAPVITITSTSYSANAFSLTWSGTGSLPVTIQRREALASGQWTAIGQQVTTGQFTDANTPPGQAFYRVVYP